MTRWLTAIVLAGCIPAGGGGGDSDRQDAARVDPDARRTIIADATIETDAEVVDRGVGGPADWGEGDARVPADEGVALDGAPPDMPPPPPLPECGDGADNDGDGRADLHDSDCTSPADPRESGDATTPCSNGEDDDGDGLVDFPDDPGCSAAGDGDEADPARAAACANGVDDDEDGAVDYPVDPGCAGRGDTDERDPPVAPECANGVDDDGDGSTDFPEDSGCEAAGDGSEVGGCGEGVEVIDLNAHLAREGAYDGTTAGAPERFVGGCGGAAGGERVFAYRVGERVERLVVSTQHAETLNPTVVYAKRRCDAAVELACGRGAGEAPGAVLVLPEPQPGVYHFFVDTGARDGGGPFRLTVDAVAVPQCRNGVDDDGDGLADNADPGCVEAEDVDEADPDDPPVCANGLDDDEDGAVDYPDDEDCEFAGTPREAPLCPPGAPVTNVGQDGGDFLLPRIEGAGASAGSCHPGFGPEHVLAIRLDEASDVQVSVLLDGVAQQKSLYARTSCRDEATEVACRALGQPGDLRLDATPRGTVYVFVEQEFLIEGQALTARVTIQSIVGDCNDEVDNDGDGQIDLADPGCEGLRDMSELDPPEPPQCSDGIDNDQDGVTDYPDDNSCLAAGDPHEGGCQGDPLWREVECVTAAWVWSSNRAVATTLQAANDARVLYTGCNHAGDNPSGLCSLDGTGWVSADSFQMAGCNNSWYHIGGRHTGNCGGHDGDTVRFLALTEDDCWDYRAAP